MCVSGYQHVLTTMHKGLITTVDFKQRY